MKIYVACTLILLNYKTIYKEREVKRLGTWGMQLPCKSNLEGLVASNKGR